MNNENYNGKITDWSNKMTTNRQNELIEDLLEACEKALRCLKAAWVDTEACTDCYNINGPSVDKNCKQLESIISKVKQ